MAQYCACHRKRCQYADPDHAILYQGGSLRVWLGPGHRAIPLRWHGDRAPLAHRKAVCRCRGGCHDTPGPVVINTGFIGYLIGGLPGAVLAAVGTFVPCYLATVIAAPYFKKYGKLPALIAFVDGITAAAIGAIAGSVVVIAQRSIIDIPTALLAFGTAALLWKIKKLPEPVIVIGAALIGLAVYPLLHH